MAAQEYYSSAQHTPHPAGSPFLAPPNPPQRASSHPGPQYPPQQPSPGNSQQPSYFPAPPPYHNNSSTPNVHFASPPPRPEQRASFSHGERPSFSQPQYPSPLQNQVQQQHLRPPTSLPQFAPRDSTPWVQQPTYPGQHMQPYNGSNLSQTSLNSGYSSDPEHNRRRHHKHKHHHSDDHGRRRKISDTSRSTTTDGFLGAAGGGLIGDLIMPGLGTLGGALAGYIGGKDYGKHRKWREDKRDREQDKWERKHSDRGLSPAVYNDRSRSGSRDRRSSHDDRRRSHDDRR